MSRVGWTDSRWCCCFPPAEQPTVDPNYKMCVLMFSDHIFRRRWQKTVRFWSRHRHYSGRRYLNFFFCCCCWSCSWPFIHLEGSCSGSALLEVSLRKTLNPCQLIFVICSNKRLQFDRLWMKNEIWNEERNREWSQDIRNLMEYPNTLKLHVWFRDQKSKPFFFLFFPFWKRNIQCVRKSSVLIHLRLVSQTLKIRRGE